MFYKKFCAICKEKGLKVTNVVTELGLSSGNMTNWKNGRIPKTSVLQKIANYLNCSVDYLLNDDEMQFGIFDSKLKKARLNKGLTQMELAEKIGVTQIDIDKWESSKSQIDDKNLKKCAEFLDVTSDYLLGKTDERKPINHDITADDIKFALFGGDSEFISDESYEDVLAFAKIVAEKEKRKRAQTDELN